MRRYETIVIFDSVLTDSQVTEQTENFKNFLLENKAIDIVVDSWGKREFAYQLKRKNYGNYIVFYYATDSAELGTRINESLRINESVLKFQTHRIADSVRKFKGRMSGEQNKAASKAKAA
ncbi:MAG: 30S ribosomal protein S6 [Bdellovibrionales bacterium]|nr:30S ribosomal protein S6 [Bdellovibrionales bacterium]